MGGNLGFYSVSHRDNHVEVVVGGVPGLLAVCPRFRAGFLGSRQEVGTGQEIGGVKLGYGSGV